MSGIANCDIPEPSPAGEQRSGQQRPHSGDRQFRLSCEIRYSPFRQPQKSLVARPRNHLYRTPEHVGNGRTTRAGVAAVRQRQHSCQSSFQLDVEVVVRRRQRHPVDQAPQDGKRLRPVRRIAQRCPQLGDLAAIDLPRSPTRRAANAHLEKVSTLTQASTA
jgi:hypothetical protein